MVSIGEASAQSVCPKVPDAKNTEESVLLLLCLMKCQSMNSQTRISDNSSDALPSALTDSSFCVLDTHSLSCLSAIDQKQ